MRELIVAMESMRGKEVDVYTKHKLFGNQHIQMRFAPLYENCFGFYCNEHSIYIKDNDILNYYVSENEIIINGNKMQIRVVKRS